MVFLRQTQVSTGMIPEAPAFDPRNRHCEAAQRPWQSIFFQVNAAQDGLLRCARNDGLGNAVSHCQGLRVVLQWFGGRSSSLAGLKPEPGPENASDAGLLELGHEPVPGGGMSPAPQARRKSFFASFCSQKEVLAILQQTSRARPCPSCARRWRRRGGRTYCPGRSFLAAAWLPRPGSTPPIARGCAARRGSVR